MLQPGVFPAGIKHSLLQRCESGEKLGCLLEEHEARTLVSTGKETLYVLPTSNPPFDGKGKIGVSEWNRGSLEDHRGSLGNCHRR